MKKSTSIILAVLAVLFLGSTVLASIGLMVYGYSKLEKFDKQAIAIMNVNNVNIANTTDSDDMEEITDSSDQRFYGKVFTTTNGLFQLTTPPTWTQEYHLNDQADLQISDSDNREYAIVFIEPMSDFADDANLEDYYRLVSNDFEDSISEAQVSAVTDIMVSGYSAKQVEVSGITDEKVKIRYLITVVETPGYFHQIWAWTTASNYETAKSDLMDVTNSFSEVLNDNANSAY